MVAWSEIIEECNRYRDGYVAVFRKYEGMPTDEKTKQGRTVNVTASSFARHVKVPEATFHDWLKKAERPAGRTYRNRRAESMRRDPEGTVKDIMELPPRAQDKIFHELKLRRAGVDTSRAARKGANAAAHARVEPIRHALATGHVALCKEALRDATEELREAQEAGVLDEKARAGITKEWEAFQFAWTEVMFSTS